MGLSALISTYGYSYLLALLTTWKLTILSFSIALVLGVVITVMRVSPISPVSAFASFYVQIFRNIPSAAYLILLVYAFPYLGHTWSYFKCVLIVSSTIPAAFCSEYLMSGMNTISVGQIEAAHSLGMGFFKTITNVVMPQSIRSVILQLTNLFVATMLTTAIASQVPLSPMDLTGLVNYINTRSVGGVTAFAISAAFYCATGVFIGRVGNRLDKKLRILR